MAQKPRNADYTKEYNRKAVLRILRHKAMSRAELARATGLTRAATSLIVEELLNLGIVTELAPQSVGRGRSATPLALRANCYYALAVDLARKGCSVGLCDMAGHLLQCKKLPDQDNLVGYYADNKRGFAVIMPTNSPISKEKNATALYKLAGDEFKDMAIANKFENAESRNVRHMNIAEFKPVAKIGEINIYRHKSLNQYYCTPYLSGVFNLVYGTNDAEINRARRELYFAIAAYSTGRMVFETRLTEGLFCKFFNIKC